MPPFLLSVYDSDSSYTLLYTVHTTPYFAQLLSSSLPRWSLSTLAFKSMKSRTRNLDSEHLLSSLDFWAAQGGAGRAGRCGSPICIRIILDLSTVVNTGDTFWIPSHGGGRSLTTIPRGNNGSDFSRWPRKLTHSLGRLLK